MGTNYHPPDIKGSYLHTIVQNRLKISIWKANSSSLMDNIKLDRLHCVMLVQLACTI